MSQCGQLQKTMLDGVISRQETSAGYTGSPAASHLLLLVCCVEVSSPQTTACASVNSENIALPMSPQDEQKYAQRLFVSAAATDDQQAEACLAGTIHSCCTVGAPLALTY